ncbi:MAG: hypothetical protein MUO60_06240 [Clostridiaceae bacterium]|nr:hypothetical protein [Clostridiaceae bacterium]
MEKVKNSSKKKASIMTYSIADFIDLSLVEILTLELLLRHSEPVVRHTLFIEISQFLQSEKTCLDLIDSKKLNSSEKRYFQFLKKQKKFSPSSFYNNLKNLEDRGLITSNLNVKGRVESIEITSLTKPLIEVILQHFIHFGVRAEERVMKTMRDSIIEKIGRTKFENLFVIWLNEYVDIQILRLTYSMSDSLFILAKNDFSKDLTQSGLTGVKFSDVYNKMIREPNEIFDMTYFPFYYRDSTLLGLNLQDLLKEAVRVTKKDGAIVITAQTKLPNTGRYLLDSMIDIFKRANIQTMYDIDELKKIFSDAGISKMDVYDFNGELIGVGWV